MLHLYILFFLILSGTVVRYFIIGQIDVTTIMIASISLVAAVVLYIVANILSKKEQAYIPANTENWSIYVLQKFLHTPKPLFKGKEQKGVYQRLFTKRWHRVVDSCIEGKAPWYLSFRLSIGDNVYSVEWEREKLLANNESWLIYKNGELFGKAATVFNLKNAVHLKESMRGTLGEEGFTITSRTINGEAKMMCDNKVVGSIKRNNLVSGVHTITVNDDQDVYILALLLFDMYFKS